MFDYFYGQSGEMFSYDLCREYIRTHYGDAAAEHAVVFEDEGFSLPKRCRNAKSPRRAFG